jgi:hypothetical protein
MSKTVNTFFIVGALYMASTNLPQAQGVQAPVNVVAQRTNASQNTGSAQSARKKLIQLGWDQPTPADLRDLWQRIENTTPFDGITLFRLFVMRAAITTRTRFSLKRKFRARRSMRLWLISRPRSLRV